MSNLIYDIKRGYLTWNGRSYRAISGPFRNGTLETGKYRIETKKVVSNILNKVGFQSSGSNQGWFIPLSPLFDSNRFGLGIHPDGGQKGTEGCIGIQGQAAEMFWKAWLTASLNNRPNYLVVVEDAKAEAVT
ncbi:murein L,D-transpeptidase [Cryomorpha ignava]|uniref:Murein L,D-transpeptidase n=1 Tax=Cryomorpha ignava TaxID=101383 RepID=A0A7K3WQ12_9FLAO|nr:murein L,D-transpeptidase [Cryomorpha ignava]NEN23578.1 murein L,D-transpeptidase [Cryomorpha ignava]